jgi:Arc/MetJ-type ribon-helix-helix transcriptional regulator
MSKQIAVRIDAAEVETLDWAVASGAAQSRSAAVRLAIAYLERRQRYDREQPILAHLHAAGREPYPDLAGLGVGSD